MSLVKVQQSLAVAGYYHGVIDGIWGSVSQKALDDALLDAAAHTSGKIVEYHSKHLTDAQIVAVAKAYSLLPSRLFALKEVESNGSGFQDVRKDILDLDGPGGFLDGPEMPKILFEAHIFSKLTGGKYDRHYPNISSAKWNRALYKAGQAEYLRLWEAMKLDQTAALKSASWGLFQIMGMNHGACGYATVQAFVEAMKQTEVKHLEACIAFCNHNNLLRPLREGNWAKFAAGYNGSGYAANQYDKKLERANQKYAHFNS